MPRLRYDVYRLVNEDGQTREEYCISLFSYNSCYRYIEDPNYTVHAVDEDMPECSRDFIPLGASTLISRELLEEGIRKKSEELKPVRLSIVEKDGSVIEKVFDSIEELSDGYHTFNELYEYRKLYNAAFFNALAKLTPIRVIKSHRHHTGEECFGGGWFIVMAMLPTGQVSNHYEEKDWDLFKCEEVEFADEWDGHTPQEAAERIREYIRQIQ